MPTTSSGRSRLHREGPPRDGADPAATSWLDVLSAALGGPGAALVVCGWVLQTMVLLSSSPRVNLVPVGLAAVCMAVAVGVVVRRPRPPGPSRSGVLTVGLTSVGFLGVGAMLTLRLGDGVLAKLLIVAVWFAVSAWFLLSVGVGRRSPWPATLAMLVTYLCLAYAFVHGDQRDFDVYTVLTEGAQGLLAGHNPYALTFTNTYSAQDVALYYGPNFLVDGRIPYGYPYPPLNLFLSLPGYLLGDVRLAGVLLTGLAFLAVVKFGTGRGRAILAALLVSAPGALFITRGWTEMLILPLAVFAVLAIQHRRYSTTAMLVGMLFVSKQYFLLAAPALWLLRPYVTRTRLLVFLGTAAALVLPWAVADPGAMYRALIGFQSAPPLRLDSLSVTVLLADWAGIQDSPVFRILPLATGLLASVVIAVLARPGLSTFLVTVALAIFATVWFSKQGFFNYYYLVAQLLVLAGYVRGWESDLAPDQHAASPAERSQADRSPVGGGGGGQPVAQ